MAKIEYVRDKNHVTVKSSRARMLAFRLGGRRKSGVFPADHTGSAGRVGRYMLGLLPREILRKIDEHVLDLLAREAGLR